MTVLVSLEISWSELQETSRADDVRGEKWLFIDYHSERKVARAFYKFAESVTRVILRIYLFISVCHRKNFWHEISRF